MRQILSAVSFLTILPLFRNFRFTDEEIGKSMRWFPLVGLMLGLVAYGFSLLTGLIPLKPEITAFIILFFLTIATGALHCDGFADMIDGFLGGKDKEDIIRIMKESQIGAFGTIGLIFLFLGKFLAITLLLETNAILWLVFIVAWSRWGVVYLNVLSSYAKETGIGVIYEKQNSVWDVIIGGIIATGASVFFCGWFAIGIPVLLIGLLHGIKSYSENKINGVTGDVYGFSIELSELVLLFLAAVITTLAH